MKWKKWREFTMRKLLKVIKKTLVFVFGTYLVDRFFWKFRHIFDKKWPEGYLSSSCFSHPHRKLLIKTISKYYPFRKVLEIGCASGPNLYLLARKFPEASFYGIDISKKAVETGNNFFQKKGIPNVRLKEGDFEKELKKLKTKSFDVVFSDAVLIYIDRKRIERVVRELIRVTKKAVILCEMHQAENLQSIFEGHWTHNFKKIFGKFIGEEKVKLTKIPFSFWEDKIWGKFGFIIEIVLL